MEGMFGFIGVAIGLYVLYGYYMLKFKKEINRTIMLPKGAEKKECKDLDGYRREMEWPLLVLGVAVTVYGGTDLYYTYSGKAEKVFLVMMLVAAAALIWYVISMRRCNKKYFGL